MYFNWKCLINANRATITVIIKQKSSTLAFDWHINFCPWPILNVKVIINPIVKKKSKTESRCISPHVSVYAALCFSVYLGGRVGKLVIISVLIGIGSQLHRMSSSATLTGDVVTFR